MYLEDTKSINVLLDALQILNISRYLQDLGDVIRIVSAWP